MYRKIAGSRQKRNLFGSSKKWMSCRSPGNTPLLESTRELIWSSFSTEEMYHLPEWRTRWRIHMWGRRRRRRRRQRRIAPPSRSGTSGPYESSSAALDEHNPATRVPHQQQEHSQWFPSPQRNRTNVYELERFLFQRENQKIPSVNITFVNISKKITHNSLINVHDIVRVR